MEQVLNGETPVQARDNTPVPAQVKDTVTPPPQASVR